MSVVLNHWFLENVWKYFQLVGKESARMSYFDSRPAGNLNSLGIIGYYGFYVHVTPVFGYCITRD